MLASPTNELELWMDKGATVAASQIADVKGYECGNIFFSEPEINEVLEIGLQFVDKGFHHPQKYIGPLYSEAKFNEYFLWPIKKDRLIPPHIIKIHTSYFIVYTRNSKEVIGVISKLTNKDFTKCIRRGAPQPELSTLVSQETDGFLCGHKFFSGEKIQANLLLARQKIGDGSTYPTPYIGTLYPEDSGYMIWPILASQRFLRNEKGDAGLYFIVLSKEGELKDTVVKGYHNNYLRCIQPRVNFSILESEPVNNSLEPTSRSGYQCGNIFFDDMVLSIAEQVAKNTAIKGLQGQYPAEYNGPIFSEPCLTWPIMDNGRLYTKGVPGPYRIVFTLKYKIKCVAIMDGSDLKLCERRSIKGQKNHDTSDYLCLKQKFSHQHLLGAANLGCERMKIARFKTFPKRYEGPRFEKDGPYFTFPLHKDRLRAASHGPHRVVMNSNCEIVGALTTRFRRSFRSFVKCHRLDDGPLPKGYFKYRSEPINEHLIHKRLNR